MSDPSQDAPHDALFKLAFSDLSEAAALLRSALPAEVVDAIDWSTLTHAKASFVSQVLGQRHADLLFIVRLGGEDVFIHVLLEHQSTVDPDMAYRSLRYVVRAWDQHRIEHRHGKLPLVIPVVVYHGLQRWPPRRSLADRIAVPRELLAALTRTVPSFDFWLVDVSAERAKDLDRRGLHAFGELTLRMVGRLPYSPDPLRDLSSWAPLLREVLAAKNGLQRFGAVLHYVNRACGLRAQELRPWAQSLGPGAERTTMGFLDEMREEGFREGLADGKAEGLAEGLAEGRGLGEADTLLRLLTLKFGALPLDAQSRVRAGTAEERARWTERVLTAESLAALLR